MLAVDRIGVPPALLAALKHAASLHNPDFYEKERNRFWTGNTPRFIRSYRETLDQLLIPRGVRPQAEAIAIEAGSRLDITEAFPSTDVVDYELKAHLRPDQQMAVDTVAAHELGVLVAPPGAGKTVMACALIARHRVPDSRDRRPPAPRRAMARATDDIPRSGQEARRPTRGQPEGERRRGSGHGPKSRPARRP